jgi:hypothetical protein
MQTATRRRTTGAVAVSLIAHLVVGVVVLLQRPTLVAREMEHGPPEAIIPILIAPRTPPATSGRLAKPTPIRLHRRPQPFLPPEAPTAPIAPPAPPTPAAAPAPPHGPIALHPSPLPEGPRGDVRTALRQSFVGCANEQAVALNRAERDLCDEKFGKGAKTAAFAGLGLSPDKQRLLDTAAARKDADYRYKYGVGTPNGQRIGSEGESGVGGSGSRGLDNIGSTAHGLGAALGNDKPDAKLPF